MVTLSVKHPHLNLHGRIPAREGVVRVPIIKVVLAASASYLVIYSILYTVNSTSFRVFHTFFVVRESS